MHYSIQQVRIRIFSCPNYDIRVGGRGAGCFTFFPGEDPDSVSLHYAIHWVYFVVKTFYKCEVFLEKEFHEHSLFQVFSLGMKYFRG